MRHQTNQLGKKDTTLQAVGGVKGLRALTNCFYDIMETEEYANAIRAMHPVDLTLAREKLFTFLMGWMGGPRTYTEKFGRLSIPAAHAKFPIQERHRDDWLQCMSDALDRQDIDADTKHYLLKQLAIPAQRIVEASAKHTPPKS